MSDLIREIESTHADSPTLWLLGHCEFAVKYHGSVFYIDRSYPLRCVNPSEVTNADMILCTHTHPSHMDPGTLPQVLKASPRAKLSKSAAEHACSIGIPLDRRTTTDADLRAEYSMTDHTEESTRCRPCIPS